MYELKRLATTDDNVVVVECPLTKAEKKQRELEYFQLPPLQLAKKNIFMLFRPVEIRYNDRDYSIQINRCTNPFCKWFGMDQERFESISNKPYRYKVDGTFDDKSMKCNPDRLEIGSGISLGCKTDTLSNWSVAEEIKRLATINSAVKMSPNYCFHKEECPQKETTPQDHPKYFYKRGKSTGKSTRFQCKECKKFTNVLPTNKENHGYH